MPDRLIILKKQLDIHLNAAMATIQQIREEAAKFGDVSNSVVDTDILTDEQIANVLAKREKTRQKKLNKS